MELGSVIVVPVVSPVSAAELAGIAACIALRDGGRVLPLSVIPPGSSARDLEDARAVVDAAAVAARALGVVAEGLVRSDLPVVGAVLACMAEQQATLTVMGWQGASTNRNVFGELIDSIVGRSTTPLAIVRVQRELYERVVLPVSEDHLLPGGGRGLRLAAELAARLQPAGGGSVTVLRTGEKGASLPPEVRSLGGPVHHDPRRVDLAVGAAAGERDLVVAAVAPTASGLRTATTHMAWAAPDAWLMVAIDVGPQSTDRDTDTLADAVAHAGTSPPPTTAFDDDAAHDIRVTARVDWERLGTVDELLDALRLVGVVGPVDESAEEDGTRRWVLTVTVWAPSANVAIGAVLSVVHESDALEGAEITYDVMSGESASGEGPPRR